MKRKQYDTFHTYRRRKHELFVVCVVIGRSDYSVHSVTPHVVNELVLVDHVVADVITPSDVTGSVTFIISC